ncbi:hypothetical protein NGM99_10115 [Mesorhizobium sp. RP14(2022)]|uniref:Uncharacterized protein n=1 Tax=Mesorhizobium liriopis TaxID=2953882 RepID=A0ABT1C7L0_9HYPH|nr:hypothetical protein [Mesorhizobium liriopis]MCO6050146.1 hypothetical protein [Mesorhizobium liriopis]
MTEFRKGSLEARIAEMNRRQQSNPHLSHQQIREAELEGQVALELLGKMFRYYEIVAERVERIKRSLGLRPRR